MIMAVRTCFKHNIFFNAAVKAVLLSVSIILLSSASGSAQSGNVTIKGNAPQYAGFNLTIKHYTNYISNNSEELGNFKVSETGSFSFSTRIEGIIYAFIDLGVLRGYIFLEPGKTYDIILPPYSPIKEADRFNPYFKHEKITIGIGNDDALALNKNINLFDDEYNFLFNKNAFKMFNRGDRNLTDRLVARLDSLFPDNNSLFFNRYKQFRYAKLYMLSMKRQKNKVINRFYSGSPVCYENPAYWETFDLLFRNFFAGYFTSKRGKELKEAYADSTGFNKLSSTLAQDSLYRQQEFREIVLLKALYDAFYSGHYDKDKVIGMFDSAARQGGSDKIRALAGELLKKVNHLRVGTPAPDFLLHNVNGKERSLASYKGKFVYLNFCNTENYTCKKDFQLLDAFSKKMRRELVIVSIATDHDVNKLEQYVKSHKYKWDFLFFGDQANVIFDYDIRAIPAYFLIDPEGNILKSPAPAPEENFVAGFYETVKNYRYKTLRKERPKEKSIYEF